jgi:hypothetical protein
MTIHQGAHDGAEKNDGRGQPQYIAQTVETAKTALHDAEAEFASTSKAVMNGMMAGSRGWTRWARDASQANLKAWQALLACRAAPAAMAIQAALWQEHVRLLAENGSSISIATWQAAVKPIDQAR